MIYSLCSEYDIATATHRALLRRYDRRDNACEVLVPAWRRVEAGESFAAPDNFLQFHREEYQQFLREISDHAWEHGVKPTHYHQGDLELQVTALKNHLQDMRTLVFREAKP